MIPLILIGAGAYLLYDSRKPKKMAEGGLLLSWQDPYEGGQQKHFNTIKEADDFVKDLFRYNDDYFRHTDKNNLPSLWEGNFDVMVKLYLDSPNVRYSKGGAIKWQDVEVGDSALVKAENKLGFIVKTYGRKFHLRFVDGTFKTYDAEELEFIKDDEFAKGGAVKRFVEMRNGKPVYALKDAIFHSSYGKLNDKGFPETTGTARIYRTNTGLKKINDYKQNDDYYVFEEKTDENGIWHIDFVEKETGLVVSFDRDDLYENGGEILDNPVFTFKTEDEYLSARSSGYIDDYDVVRIQVSMGGRTVDYPLHSEEEYIKDIKRLKEIGADIQKVYQDKMYYDIQEYADDTDDYGDDDEYDEGGSIERSYVMFIDSLQDAERLAEGGSFDVSFDEKLDFLDYMLKNVSKFNRAIKGYPVTVQKDIKKSIEDSKSFLRTQSKNKKAFNQIVVPMYRTLYSSNPEVWRKLTRKYDFDKDVTALMQQEMGMGGKVKFKDKVKAISENLKGREVPKKLQKEYGKTYDKKWERDESARRIAGSQLKKMNEN